MDVEKLIIETPFTGIALNTVRADGTVYFRNNMTAEEYVAKEHPTARIVTYAEYEKLHAEFYIRPFVEISEEDWWEYFEQLPPLAARNLDDKWYVYFCLEAMSGIFNACYLKNSKTKKCYAGMYSRFSTNEQLLELIKIQKLDGITENTTEKV